MKTVLVDDEINALQLLDELLAEMPEISVVERFTDPVKALVFLKNTPVDLIFLDIQMPILSGLELMRGLRMAHIDVLVVFITAYDQYALDAFHQEAFDYLLKPVSLSDVKGTIGRLVKHFQPSDSREKLDRLLARMIVPKIQIPDRNGISFYNPEDIVYVEAEGNYSYLFMKSTKVLVTRQIGTLAELLSEHGFIRSNRSFLINSRYLTRLNRKQHTCLLAWDAQSIELPVAEERMKQWG